MIKQINTFRPRAILFVHSSNELYGSDKVLLELVCGLDRKHFEPIVILPSDIQYEGKLGEALKKAGITYYEIKMGVLRRHYFSILGLIRYFFFLVNGIIKINVLVRRHHICLIHSNTIAVWGGAIVARIHGISHIWHVHEIMERPKWLGRLLYSLICANSTQVIAISKAVANHICKHGQPTNIQVIYNGIDCDVFSPYINGQQFKKQWHVSENTVIFGLVGRISHWKGQELFLDAAAKTIEVYSSIHFVLIGDPIPGEEWRLIKLQTQINNLCLTEKVTLMPFHEAVPKIMRALDVLVLPSTLPEPFGLVLLEAMACERCVIATSHGGPLEIVVHNKTGLLIPPNNSSALSAAMVSLATDSNLRYLMGRGGRQRVLKLFSLNIFRSKFAQLYSNLTESN